MVLVLLGQIIFMIFERIIYKARTNVESNEDE